MPGITYEIKSAADLKAFREAEAALRLDTVLDIPVAQAFCPLAAIAERHGFPLPGPSFTEREILARIKQSGGLPAQSSRSPESADTPEPAPAPASSSGSTPQTTPPTEESTAGP